MEGLELAHILVDSVVDKKGTDILLLDIREQSIFADYFLLCTGDNIRQLKALADAIVDGAKESGFDELLRLEGEPESGWILVDFGDIVVHLFDPDKRVYYNLEDLWNSSHVVLRMQ